MPPPATEAPILEIRAVRKRYQGLRPLRIEGLTIAPLERVAIAGLDLGAAEVFVNLVTGAGLPDEGEVRVLGQSTADIAHGDEWLASLDRFGIVSERAVMLEGATLQQNLAMPFGLQIDPVPPAVAEQVAALAAQCGIPPESLHQRTSQLPPETRFRAHLARAIALDPVLVIFEHPTATIVEAARAPLARDIVRVCDSRALAALVITEDEPFARLVAHRSLSLEAATGKLRPHRKRWLRL